MPPHLCVLFAAVEVDPYAVQAGLAQVAGSLPQAIKALSQPDAAIDIRVIMPKYGSTQLRELHRQRPFRAEIAALPVPFEGREHTVNVESDDRYGVMTYLTGNEDFFGCDERIYWPGEEMAPGCSVETPNIRRFAFFSRAVLNVAKALGFRPDVIHCNDWHTALIPVFLRTTFADDPFFAKTGCVLTLHNVGRGFQGIWATAIKPDILERAGLAAYAHLYDRENGLGHSANPHAPGPTEINLLKGGIAYADRANAVSPTYAREMLEDPVITGSEGFGGERYNFADNLIPFLRRHQGKLSGIVNGIDTHFRNGSQPKGWDPAADTCLAQTYSRTDLDTQTGRIPGKQQCKAHLQQMAGLPLDDAAPLIGMVGRLEPQKGIALLLHDLAKGTQSRLHQMGVQLIVCGRPLSDATGRLIRQQLAASAHLFSAARGAVEEPASVGRFGWLRADMSFVPETFLHQFFAGCDMILMPSEYEPCGTPQMIGHRYGAVPIVRKTGGLADTVTDGEDGFAFESAPWGTHETKIACASAAMLDAIERAVVMYRMDRRSWSTLVYNAMSRDHSWAASAGQYLELYWQARAGPSTPAPRARHDTIAEEKAKCSSHGSTASTTFSKR